MTRRRAILEALRSRVAAITVDNGFSTDAGAALFLNEVPALGPDDPEVAIAMLVDDDEVAWQGKKVLLRLPVRLIALARADLDAPWTAVENVLGDIKRAVELEDRLVGGLLHAFLERGVTSTREREAGSDAVGCEVPYIAPYSEGWGDPGNV